jgi:hypothetical protein
MPMDYNQQKQLAMQWKRATPYLAAARRYDIEHQDTSGAIESLNELCKLSIKRTPLARTSGFVEMYRILNRSNR